MYLVKVLSGPVWEGRLAKYAAVFSKRRDEFEFALTIHVAKGVDNANQGIQRVEQTTQDLNAKMDMMLQLFQRLASPEYNKIAAAVDQRGGIKTVQQNEKLIKELSEMEPKSSVGAQNATQNSRNKGQVSNSSLEEILDDLNTDPDEAISNNMKAFSRKFEIQTNQIKEEMDRIVRREGDRIIGVFTSGPHDRILDPVCFPFLSLFLGGPV